MNPTVHAKLEQFLHRLQADLALVEASNASEEQKQEVRELTQELLEQIETAPGSWPEAVQHLAGTITELNIQIQMVVSEQLGACEYDGGCIVTTESQCQGLGGKWSRGTPCPSITGGAS
jgi:hypothetical protein